MIEKEALTLRKIKKDINRNIGILTLEVFELALLFWIFCILTINTVKPGTASPIEEIVLIILTVTFGMIFVYAIVLWLPFTFCAWRKKYKITTEKLVVKEEKTDYADLLAKSRRSIWEIPYREGMENIYYVFYFERSGSYRILFMKYYKWSELHSMIPRELVFTSEVGDTFTVVTFNKKIFMIYNNKYFEPTFNLR